MSSKEGSKAPKPAPTIPEFPSGWIVRPIGSWDPVMHEGPGFHSTTHGPYGYYAYHGPEDRETDESQEEGPAEPKQQEEPAKEQDEAAMEQEQA